MKIAAVIPARLMSSRFPEKLLQDLCGKTVLQRTYQAVVDSGLFDEICIATDSEKIALVGQSFGAKVIKTGTQETGTDRIAEAASALEADVIINVQGDEPFINTKSLAELKDLFLKDTDEKIQVASLMQPLPEEEIGNPNIVKVVTDGEGFAMYFSRAAIPFNRDGGERSAFRHIGVYAFRRACLLDFAQWPLGRLENTEKIEALRFLEHRVPMKMILTHEVGIGIDTEEDLQNARVLWES